MNNGATHSGPLMYKYNLCTCDDNTYNLIMHDKLGPSDLFIAVYAMCGVKRHKMMQIHV